MLTMTNRRKVRGALVALTLALASTSAQASRNETFRVQGSTCQQDDFQTAGKPFYVYFGVANSSTTATLSLTCPLAATLFDGGNFQGKTFLGASGSTCGNDPAARPWVDVYARNSQAITCTLFHMNSSGQPVSTFSVSGTGPTGPVQRLFFNVMGERIRTQDTLTVTCGVPPAAADLSYVAGFGVPVCELF
jgi:hypothetical protein